MKKLRVGVLMGGKGIEKEVSFNSGRTICDHLDPIRYTVIPLFQSSMNVFLLPWHFLHRGKITDFEHRLNSEATAIEWDSLKEHVDFIYIAQHGRYAEDGTLQGFLEILKIPYLGSKVLASALRMDKITQKTFLTHAGINVPKHIIVEPYEIDNFTLHKHTLLQRLSRAGITDFFVVKPFNEGSSLGTSVVQEDALEQALSHACYIEQGYKKRVIIEEKIKGMEFTCIVLVDNTTHTLMPLPPTEIIPEDGTLFFDYEQKYMPGRGIKHTPARCNPEIINAIQQTSCAVMRALDFNTIGRIDGFVTQDNKVVIIDPNTLSGMAPSSFIFNQAAEVGMSTTDIINHIIETELYTCGILDSIMKEQRNSLALGCEKKIRVAVLLGGASNEKETSLDSGRNVYYKLDRQKYEPIAIFVNKNLELYRITQSQLVRNSTGEIEKLLESPQRITWHSLPSLADFVFIGLHGGEGENGCVQGTLEILGLPYNGSSVLASALCMNKYKTNTFLSHHGFDVPKNQLITRADFFNTESHDIYNSFIHQAFEQHKSIIIKPHDDGCSVMVQKVSTYDELDSAITSVLQQKEVALIEECITGMELTVGVLGNDSPQALPPSQAIANGGILSIEEKFLPGAGENQTPAPLAQDILQRVQTTMEHVYKTIGCKGYARIDCFYQNENQSPTGTQRVVVLEINTLPGMTPATCIFHQAAEVGMRPSEFIDRIIQLGFELHTPEHTACDMVGNTIKTNHSTTAE